MPVASQALEALWLDALRRVGDRAAHEVRGALNGVAVNVEVVRSRTARGDASESTARFATTAAEQVEAVAGMAEGLLALVRAPREPAELRDVVKQLLAVLVPAARAAGGELRFDDALAADGARVRAPGDVVRLLAAEALLAAVAARTAAECRLTMTDDTVTLAVTGGGLPELPAPVREAAADAEIACVTGPEAITIAFPRLTGRAPEPA